MTSFKRQTGRINPEIGAAGRIRTHDPLVRSQVLYPTELQPRKSSIVARFQVKAKWFDNQLKYVIEIVSPFHIGQAILT